MNFVKKKRPVGYLYTGREKQRQEQRVMFTTFIEECERMSFKDLFAYARSKKVTDLAKRYITWHSAPITDLLSARMAAASLVIFRYPKIMTSRYETAEWLDVVDKASKLVQKIRSATTHAPIEAGPFLDSFVEWRKIDSPIAISDSKRTIQHCCTVYCMTKGHHENFKRKLAAKIWYHFKALKCVDKEGFPSYEAELIEGLPLELLAVYDSEMRGDRSSMLSELERNL